MNKLITGQRAPKNNLRQRRKKTVKNCSDWKRNWLVKTSISGSRSFVSVRKKARRDVRGPRGRLISLERRQTTVSLVKESVTAGARLFKDCVVAHINVSTYGRWQEGGVVQEDKQPHALRPTPANKLDEAEREKIIEVRSRPEYQSVPPSQIVTDLADDGVYVGSESSYYRVLREANQQHDRASVGAGT